MADRIAATVLAGFLGAGKTTLLQRVLSDPQGVRFGVLVNDFGAINIDADLVAGTAADRVSLTNGCVCCSIRDDLLAAVAGLLDAPDPPERLLIEASGVSRPLAITEALEAEPRVEVDGVFCLIDSAGFEGLDYADTELAMDQAFGADIALLNKADLVDAATLARIEATLRGAMPRLRTLPCRHGDVPRALLFGDVPRAREAGHHGHRHGPGHDNDHCHHHHDDHHHDHAAEFESWSHVADAPLSEAAFRDALGALPEGLLRAKGVLDLDGRRAVFHLVGKRRSLVFEPGPPPAESRIVAIARAGQLDPAALAALAGAPQRG